MTILDQITREASSLSATERRQALRLIKSLRATTGAEPAPRARRSAIDKRKLHPALRAIAGMWKDRKDLPKNGAANPKPNAKGVPGSDQEQTYIPKDRALRAIAGMWKDRTDLPKDPVAAVKEIRARMRSRGRRHA